MTSRKSYITVFIFFFLFTSLTSQTKFIENFYGGSFSQKYTVERWSTDNGLPQNSVNSITQTTDGFLWVGTEEGAVRFDGERFNYINISTSPGLKFSRIKCVQGDNEGGLWIGGEVGGLAYLRNNTIIDYSSKLPEYVGSVYKIKIADNGNVWIGAGNKLLKFDGTEFKVIYSSDKSHITFNDLLILNSNKIIFSTYEGIFKTDSLGNVDVLAKGLIAASLVSVSDNEIMIGHRNQLQIFSLKTNRIIKNLTKKRQFNGYEKLLKDRNGNIWWGSIDFGLYVLMPDFSEVKFEHPVLDKGYVNILYEDNFGNIWVGTGAYGLFKISKRNFYGISLYNGFFTDIINQIYQRKDGSVWAGSNCGGVVKINKSKISYFFDGSSEKNKSCIWSIMENADFSLYLGTYSFGVYKFKPETGESFTIPGSISALTFFDDGDSVWAGGVYGLYVIKNDSAYLFKSKYLSDQDWINTIVKDKNGEMWIAGKSGLYKRSGNDFKLVALTDENPHIPVRPIYFDENNDMFIGTYGYGMFVLDSGKFININKKNGLFDNTIHTIFEDADHNLWMTSNHGVFVVKKERILSFRKDNSVKITSKVFTKKLGFSSSEFNGVAQPAHVYLNDGTLLFPSMEGIVAVNVNSVELNEAPPRVIIDEFLIDGKMQPMNDDVIVNADYSDVEIKFTAINFSSGEEIQFKYKIEGLDKNWSRPSYNREILLKSIPPGEYVFKVKAKINLSSWGENYEELRFTVEPKFYQTKIFKILIILSFIAIVLIFTFIYSNIQRRISKRLAETVKIKTQELQTEIIKKEKVLKELKLAKEEEERQRRLAEKFNREKTEMLRIISHNLKNPIGVIRSSAILINEESETNSVEKELSDIIKKASEETLEGIEEILQHSEIEDLEFKLSVSEFNFNELVEDVLEKNKQLAKIKNQKIHFENNSEEDLILSADKEKVSLAIDNYISNAIKYSPFGENIKVKIENRGKEVFFSVIDNGPGISTEEQKYLFGKFKKLSARPTGNESSSGLGLSIVKKIIELHGGQVGVISDGEKGSEFFFIIPKSQE